MAICPNGQRANRLRRRDLVTAGRLRPEIAAVLPLAQARRPHELGETGHTGGKIVLQVI